VPFQVWLFEPRHQVNEDFSFLDSNDLYFVTGTGAIAIIAYLIGLLTRARWATRLPISLFLIAVLAVLPIGVFAAFIALAAYAVTGRLQITFALAVMFAVIVGVVAGCIISRIVGICSIWPLAEASANACLAIRFTGRLMVRSVCFCVVPSWSASQRTRTNSASGANHSRMKMRWTLGPRRASNS
jgi:hypothetical protein